MDMRNQHNRSQEQEHKPALEARKARGNSECVGRYLTKTGKVGVEIFRSASGFYRYIGAWGAGSGLTAASMLSSLSFMLSKRRGVVILVAFPGAMEATA